MVKVFSLKAPFSYFYLPNRVLISSFQSSVGYDHQSELSKHGSQTDAAKGFGGKFGVQKDRQDKVRLRNNNWYLVQEYEI